jgi:CubicO group peptidase (beta-lactamase class C family)
MRQNLVVVGMMSLVLASAHVAAGGEFIESAAREAEGRFQFRFDTKLGAIVIGLVDAEGSKVLAFGGLDDGTDRPVDGDSVFFIGSVSKTFTSLLLAEMAECGDVQLDEPLAQCLPESVRVPAYNDKPITLFHLAAQSAGFPINADNMTGADAREQYETYDVEKMYEYVRTFELSREPGAEFEYSNVGMALLGHALSRRAGVSFDALVVERICRPLGMTSTAVTPTADMKSRLAMGRDEQGRSTGPWQLDAYAPAGSVHSTANDLVKYAAAQAGNTRSSLSRAIDLTHVIRHEGAKRVGGDAPKVFGRTAMPWMDCDAVQPPGMQLLGHAGGAGSHHAWVGFDMNQHRGVVVLTTDNSLSVEAVGWTLLQRELLTPERLLSFAQNMVGIGVALGPAPGTSELQIVSVLPDTPAAEAGLSVGMTIQAVDDVALRDKELAECMALLRGPAGAKVRLVVRDPATNAERTVEMTRRKFRT